MSEPISLRAQAESKQLFQGLRTIQEANRISEAAEASQAMEEKTARLRALRLAREAEAGRTRARA